MITEFSLSLEVLNDNISNSTRELTNLDKSLSEHDITNFKNNAFMLSIYNKIKEAEQLLIDIDNNITTSDIKMIKENINKAEYLIKCARFLIDIPEIPICRQFKNTINVALSCVDSYKQYLIIF